MSTQKVQLRDTETSELIAVRAAPELGSRLIEAAG
jgi:hypothetical protein